MKLATTSIVRVAKDQLAASVSGEIVILGMATGRYYGVNSVGARVWELIQAPISVADIRDVIATEYDVERQQCEVDVVSLIEHMMQARLVEVTAEPAH